MKQGLPLKTSSRPLSVNVRTIGFPYSFVMCKQSEAEFCSELGRNSDNWSKCTPLEKPKWISDSFETITNVIELASAGETEIAQSRIRDSRDLEMRIWYNTHAQNTGKWRFDAFGVAAPKPILPLDPLKSFSNFETELFARDRFKCRYCDVPVLPKNIFEVLQSQVGDTYLPLGRTNLTRSGFYLMFVATLDHVLPWSLGGRTDSGNLVTCCWPCNYGKANYTVEQLGISNPLHRYSAVENYSRP
jgi:hypothetical protein